MLLHTILLLCAVRTFVSGFAFDGHGVDTLFPGPWEAYQKAPNGRIIRPSRVWGTEGDVVDAEGLTQGKSTTLKPGSLVTYEFPENLAGR